MDWQPIATCPKDGSYFKAAQFLPGRPIPVFECEAHWFVWANPAGVYRREAVIVGNKRQPATLAP